MNPVARTQELTRKYLDRFATPAEIAELERLLQESAPAADAFAQLTREEGQLAAVVRNLAGVHQAQSILGNFRPPRRPWYRRAAIWASLAASVAIVLGLFVWQFSRRGSNAVKPNSPIDRDGEVAKGNRVIRGEVLLDDRPARTIPDGSTIAVHSPEGAAVELADGSKVDFDRGSRAVLFGPAEGVRQLVELSAGAGTFQVTKGNGEFRVETPYGQVTALGTEFRVGVLPSNERGDRLSVAVLEGLVEVRFAGKRHLLWEGESRVFQSRGEAERGLREVRGIVQAVGAGKISLKLGGDRVKIADYPLDPKATVVVDERPAKLSDLAEGMIVFVQRQEGAETILRIRAEGPTIAGNVRAVNLAERTITLAGSRGEGFKPDMTYPVSADAQVLINGEPATLADVPLQANLVLKLSADRKTVMSITVGRKREGMPKK